MCSNINIKKENCKTNKLKIQKSEKKGQHNFYILKKCGNEHCEITYSDIKMSGCFTHKKISKKQYVNVKTGEVYNYKLNDKKTNEGLKKTFKNLKDKINCNFDSHSKNQLFVTLTYAENMTDSQRLQKDFKQFIQRLYYKFPKYKFTYIAVYEPQERGAWHIHLMLKANNITSLFIDHEVIEQLWGFGATTTTRLKSDNVGQYYVTYFTDVLEEDKQGNKTHKKGTRLHLYPKNFKFYTCSRNIKKPIIEKGIVEGKKIIDDLIYKVAYKMSYELVDSMGKIYNHFDKIYYKKRDRVIPLIA